MFVGFIFETAMTLYKPAANVDTYLSGLYSEVCFNEEFTYNLSWKEGFMTETVFEPSFATYIRLFTES